MRQIRPIALSVVFSIAVIGVLVPSAANGAEPEKVAIIVGPVGEALTPVYIGLAEKAALAAEARGAVVARAYSPSATPANVLAAVEGANIVVYLGHGVGTPNPYSATPDPGATNGWGLQGPNARGDHADSWADGTLAYYGEAWIAANARPAPGWVMIYSNACYAAGAGEPQYNELTSPETAAERVATYSRTPLALLGASAYFATDFYEGAARLIGTLLDQQDLPYGEVFASEPLFASAGLSMLPHATVAGAEVWLHHSAYFDGAPNYWYAFAGNAAATFSGSTVPNGAGLGPLVAVDGTVIGRASYYPDAAGWEGIPAVALPTEIGGGIPNGDPATVVVCADRCVTVPVVDSCPCYVGTADQRVANLSASAWAAVTDRPFSDGLVEVRIDIRPEAEREAPPASAPDLGL